MDLTFLEHLGIAAVVGDGDGRIAYLNGSAARLLGVDPPAAVGRPADEILVFLAPEAARSAIESADVLLTQLESPLEAVQRAVDIAGAAEVRVILNPAPARDLPESLLQGVHILTPNRTEAALLSGESEPGAAADALRAMGCGTVVVTLGAEGALLASDGENVLLPSFSVVPTDTTAAGDAFVGGFAVALAEFDIRP